jgi:hypothetical protein
MRNIFKGMSVPVSLAILALVFIAFDAQAYNPDARNDFMCAAIFKVAFEQEAAGTHPREGKLKYYSNRIAVLRWKLLPTKDTYEQTVFNNRVGQYMDELDSADVLLHMDRCKNRALEVYAEYLNKGEWRKKG